MSYARILYDNTSLRCGPGPMYVLIGKGYEDERYPIMATDRRTGWYHIIIGPRQKAWVYYDDVEVVK